MDWDNAMNPGAGAQAGNAQIDLMSWYVHYETTPSIDDPLLFF